MEIWFGMVLYNMVWHGTRCGQVCYGMVRYNTVWYDIILYDKHPNNLTNAVPVVILVPPDAPATNTTSPVVLLVKIIGLIEDMGRFPGLMKLLGDGSTP